MRTPIFASTLGAVLVTVLIGVGTAIAQPPKQNVSKALHPNLARAQKQSAAAYESITMAQQANEWDLAGHAAKAKQLLDQVNNELKQAAEQSNANKKKQ
jgi:hypothetical protein